MITCLVAEHKRVLFVAEKRAAIDAVLRRLEGRSLSELVLDIHDGVKNKRKIAQDLDAALRTISQIPVPDVADLHRGLSNRVRRIDDHAAVVNEVRDPWGVSLFNAQARLMRIPQRQRSMLRVRGGMLQELAGEAAERARDDLREYAELQDQVHTPWAGADIRSREDAELASDMARNLSAVAAARTGTAQRHLQGAGRTAAGDVYRMR